MTPRFTERERAVHSAWNALKAAVDKLTKYELREWADRIPNAQEAVKAARQRLYEAWDAQYEEWQSNLRM